MPNIKLLDCTLRDGSLVNNGDYTNEEISKCVEFMAQARLDYIEIGYLNTQLARDNSAYFADIQTASGFIPPAGKRGEAKYTVMVNLGRFKPELLIRRSSETVDIIRVAFYKNQIEEAIEFCEAVESLGYGLFLQPMITVDYTMSEYDKLLDKFLKFNLSSVAVVDSFGYITRQEIIMYMQMLERKIQKHTSLGFHGHNNMQLSLLNADALFSYETSRDIIIDATVMGIGRGAGNLNLELICNSYNQRFGNKYLLEPILSVASSVIAPIAKTHNWGYSPYYLLTSIKKCHQCFAQYLLENHEISIDDFAALLDTIPPDMKTKCTRPYVEELYQNFKERIK